MTKSSLNLNILSNELLAGTVRDGSHPSLLLFTPNLITIMCCTWPTDVFVSSPFALPVPPSRSSLVLFSGFPRYSCVFARLLMNFLTFVYQTLFPEPDMLALFLNQSWKPLLLFENVFWQRQSNWLKHPQRRKHFSITKEPNPSVIQKWVFSSLRPLGWMSRCPWVKYWTLNCCRCRCFVVDVLLASGKNRFHPASWSLPPGFGYLRVNRLILICKVWHFFGRSKWIEKH